MIAMSSAEEVPSHAALTWQILRNLMFLAKVMMRQSVPDAGCVEVWQFPNAMICVDAIVCVACCSLHFPRECVVFDRVADIKSLSFAHPSLTTLGITAILKLMPSSKIRTMERMLQMGAGRERGRR